MIFLGIDPGSLRTGWGVVRSDGQRHALVEAGLLAPVARLPLPDKLLFIHAGLRDVIERLRPDAVAVEDVFHAVNTRSALILGHVRGVALLAGAQAGLPVHKFAPATVKAQVVGFGRAEKGQVALMVTRLLELDTAARPGDTADALAVALCLACSGLVPQERHLTPLIVSARSRRRA